MKLGLARERKERAKITNITTAPALAAPRSKIE